MYEELQSLLNESIYNTSFLLEILPSDAPQDIGQCPESWIPFQSHCYNFNANEMSWAQSVTQCLQSGNYYFYPNREFQS